MEPATRTKRKAALAESEFPSRLRSIREGQGMSVRELARRLQISPSAISQIETGRARPSVSTLYAIVSELGVSLDALFADEWTPARETPKQSDRESPATDSPTPVQPRDSRAEIVLDTGVQWQRLTARQDPGVDFLSVTYPVGSSSSPDNTLMRHNGHEYGIVLTGRLEVTVGFDRYELGPGDAVQFESTTPHRLRNTGDEPVTAIWFVIGRHGSDPRVTPFAVAAPGAPLP